MSGEKVREVDRCKPIGTAGRVLRNQKFAFDRSGWRGSALVHGQMTMDYRDINGKAKAPRPYNSLTS